MAAPIGNRFWEARASHGRPALYENAQDLWNDCVEYFEWVDNNPLKAAEPIKHAGGGTLMSLPKMRAMTLSGLYTFLQISPQTWHNYRTRSKEFMEITARVEAIIFQQKFEGAAADLLNANLIAREIGLADKQDHSHSGQIVTEIRRVVVRPEDTDR